MSTTSQIASLLRAVYFGGNWTASNYKDHLFDVTLQEATTKVYSLNTIATLVFHTGYYITAVTKVLNGGPLDAKDKYSFDHPPVDSQEQWTAFLEKTYTDAEDFAKLIEQLPEDKLYETFTGDKYGNYYRNLHGIIEHLHYHLGQIVIIKKILRERAER